MLRDVLGAGKMLRDVLGWEDVEGCAGLTCGGLDRRHLTSLLRREAAGGPTALRAMGGPCL